MDKAHTWSAFEKPPKKVEKINFAAVAIHTLLFTVAFAGVLAIYMHAEDRVQGYDITIRN